VSIPANIAEGCGRESSADFARFLQIAMGSASELEYHLILANELGYLDKGKADKYKSAVIEVKKMLAGLIGRARHSPDN
jgi:four helix bundle protein